MKNSKHTPGPWAKSGRGIKSKTRMICCQSIADAECDANAHLIAAAPEMLGALERLLDPKFRNDTGWTSVARLVKKARGEK